MRMYEQFIYFHSFLCMVNYSLCQSFNITDKVVCPCKNVLIGILSRIKTADSAAALVFYNVHRFTHDSISPSVPYPVSRKLKEKIQNLRN